MRCDACQDRLLDLEYGLLDPAEVAALEEHVADCISCTAARDVARDHKGLLARAAKSSFPNVRFEPPTEGVTIPRRQVPRSHVVRWAVAAGILLAVAGTIGPTINSSIRSAADRRSTQSAVATVRQARQVWTAEKTAMASRTAITRNVLESATKTHDTLVTEWVKAEAAALEAKPIAVEVTGPASAVAGAPNDYCIRVSDPLGKNVAAKVRVAVTDSAGTVRAEATYEPTAVTAGVTFRLPATAWTDLPAGSGLTLAVTADDGTGRTSQLAEPINLLPPVYTTFLATDRPLYQPGDNILFRSVTLDRTRFLPPDRDLTLRFILLDARGREVPDMKLSGMSTPAVLDGKSQPISVLGPDGRPVRGVGCGEFRLSDLLASGEYTLAVYELPAGWAKPELPPGSIPLARRNVAVRKYVQERVKLEFTAPGYGPGDTVVARLSASDAGRPLANVQILPAASADGKRVTPVQAPFLLDAEGKATISFVLPNEPTLANAELKVTLLTGQPEEIIRPVPLTLKSVDLEFFPEGGDLVAGVESRVYFRARTPDGKPAEYRGELFDGENVLSPVATVFDTNQPGSHRGHGVFTLTPVGGKKYVLRGPAGEFPLPTIKPDGVSMTIPVGVTGADQPITVRLATGKGKKNLIVGAYSRGRPVATARVAVQAGQVTTAELRHEPGSPGGVTRVTVFEESDDDGPGRKVLTPVAERLMFRRPTEALVLNYTVTSGQATPGSPVVLKVTAKSETGQPTGAVLWAAVVSETIFGQADDRTTRGLPAHFYICGEVEKPEDLENADFLLTDHPNASKSLDLLLGTQGWRRFAEQAPEVFRRTAPPADADRLMVAVGSRGPVPAEFRTPVRGVAEKYQPQYERALVAVEAAERGAVVDTTAVNAAYAQYAYGLQTLAKATDRLEQENNDWGPMRIPAAIALLIVAGLCTLIRYQQFRPEDAERKYLAVGALVAAGLALFLIVTVAVDSRTVKSDLTEEFRQASEHGVNYLNTGPAPAIRVGTSVSTDEPRIHLLETGAFVPGTIQRSNPATSIPPGAGSPLESAANGRPSLRTTFDPDLRRSRLERDFARRSVTRITAAAPPGPAADRVMAAAATLPPLVVREYSHAGINLARPNHFDATDTVLWKPVLIVPGSGAIDVTFGLSGSPSGYRVLIAGHTLDGRVGTVTGKLPVDPAK